jgi:hypothetical protein
MTAAIEGGEWTSITPWPTLPLGNTRYPSYRRLGGPQGRSGRVENLAPSGFDPRTVQPVISRYTDWATRPTLLYTISSKCSLMLFSHVYQYLSGVPFTFLEYNFICTCISHSFCSCNIPHSHNSLLVVVPRNKLMNTPSRKEDEIIFFSIGFNKIETNSWWFLYCMRRNYKYHKDNCHNLW